MNTKFEFSSRMVQMTWIKFAFILAISLFAVVGFQQITMTQASASHWVTVNTGYGAEWECGAFNHGKLKQESQWRNNGYDDVDIDYHQAWVLNTDDVHITYVGMFTTWASGAENDFWYPAVDISYGQTGIFTVQIDTDNIDKTLILEVEAGYTTKCRQWETFYPDNNNWQIWSEYI